MNIYENLKCPVCSRELLRVGGSLVCEARHTYDVSKEGYVNLTNTASQKISGDSKEMARARNEFLATGAYAPLASLLSEYSRSVVVDAGCGEGYYTRALAGSAELCYGFDLSKSAVSIAAKRASASGLSDKTFFGVGTVYSLPLRDGCADTLINVFAPCVEEEYERVLAPGGRLIVACAGRDHLAAMKRVLYENTRENTERMDLPGKMRRVDFRELKYDIDLTSRDMIKNLYLMTPYCFKTSIEAQERLFSLDRLKTEVHFNVYVYEK